MLDQVQPNHLLVAMCVCTVCSTPRGHRNNIIEPSLLCYTSMYAWATLKRARSHIGTGSAVHLRCGAATCSYINFATLDATPNNSSCMPHAACLGRSIQLMWVHSSGTCICITQIVRQHVQESYHTTHLMEHPHLSMTPASCSHVRRCNLSVPLVVVVKLAHPVQQQLQSICNVVRQRVLQQQHVVHSDIGTRYRHSIHGSATCTSLFTSTTPQHRCMHTFACVGMHNWTEVSVSLTRDTCCKVSVLWQPVSQYSHAREHITSLNKLKRGGGTINPWMECV